VTADPTASTFRALSDPSRRLLLDRLFERDGQTLGELTAHLPAMTRFGVMRHLGVLEEAGLVTTRRQGREKRHFLNPIPIRLVHDRWIGKFAEPVVGAMAAMKTHLEAEAMATPDHVYSVYIKAAPDRIWRAITDGIETERYYYGTRVASDWILEIDPGRLVTMSFHARWDPEIEAEGPVRMTWAIEPAGDGLSKLTVTTADAGVKTAAEFGGGIVHIVSGLKTYVETGQPMAMPAEVG
jgi:DNA-binding transcriptional ArsR family regulator